VLRYFKSMAAFFTNARRAIRPGGRAALVVGTNRTVLGGQEFVIDTPRLLIDVGVRAGFAREHTRPMDTYRRYDLHQRNSIDSETLIVLRVA
jgi:site-specific DNA-methyltransferase (cytosine-N4-specific)